LFTARARPPSHHVPSSSPKASAVVDNCHFEGIAQDRGAVASVGQGGVFSLTTSTIISRTTYNSVWGSDSKRSLFFFDDAYEVSPPPPYPSPHPPLLLPLSPPSDVFFDQGVLQLVYNLEQVKAFPMAKLEITDTQVCMQHTAPAHLHSHLHCPARRRSLARAAPTHRLAQVTHLVSTLRFSPTQPTRRQTIAPTVQGRTLSAARRSLSRIALGTISEPPLA
jgi:hypothetical protein